MNNKRVELAKDFAISKKICKYCLQPKIIADKVATKNMYTSAWSSNHFLTNCNKVEHDKIQT